MPLIRALGVFFLGALLVGCNCENRVDGELIDECVEVAYGMDDFAAKDACEACCQNEGYEIGQVHFAQGDDADCSCGDVGTCDE